MSLRRALVAIPLLAATAAAAQPPAAPAPTQGRIGVGVALGASGVLPAIYVPIDIDRARMEFELGYEGTSPTDDEGDSTRRVGLGLFGLVPAEGPVRGYGGVRLRYARIEDVDGDTASGFRVAAAFGGEWVPHPSVALGAEAQVGYSFISRPDGAPNRMDATAHAFLRVFTSFGGRAASAPATPAATPSAGPPSAPPPAAPRAPARPKRLVRCESSADCEGVEICYEGHCRR